MDVLVLIDKLDDLVHNAKPVPLTDQVRVDKEEIYDILDQMRATIPEEIKQARWIVKERQEMLAEAKREAERIVKEARERQERLVSEEEVTKQAERAAEDIIEDARAASARSGSAPRTTPTRSSTRSRSTCRSSSPPCSAAAIGSQGKDEPAEVRDASASSPGASRAREPIRSEPLLEELIARGERLRADPPRDRARGDPHLGHHRHAEGRRAQAARLVEPARGAVLEDPAEGARDDDDRRADVPLVGLRHFTLAPAAASTLVLRRRFDPEETLRAIAQHRASALAVVPVMLQRILELPQRRSPATTCTLPEGDRRQRLGAAGRAGDAGDGHLRRRALQPLRLDRGRLGDDRHARGSARRARDRRAAAAGDGREAARRATATRCRRASAGGSSSPTRWSFEGYTGGGGKEIVGA
jgi:vacuolar-type H+-ATPase subunit H